jgi:hypothetical protein
MTAKNQRVTKTLETNPKWTADKINQTKPNQTNPNTMTMAATSPTTVITAAASLETDTSPKTNNKDGNTSTNSSPNTNENENTSTNNTIVRTGVPKEISKQVLRQKLNKLRHLVIPQGIDPSYLDDLFPQMLDAFDPQTVHYNGGVANLKEWKISCYLEVMPGGIPCTNPNRALLELFQPLLDTCNELFLVWYRQQHACNGNSNNGNGNSNGNTIERSCKRLMTFLTRYTPAPGEQALLKVSG